MKYITLVMLTRADACDSQRLVFEDTFGKKAELTEANVAKAIEAGLDFVWLTLLLPQSVLEAYRVQLTPLWGAHRAQQEPLWKAHEAQLALLWEAYRSRPGLLRKAYHSQRSDLLGDYAARRRAMWKAYEEQRNTLLLNTLLAA